MTGGILVKLQEGFVYLDEVVRHLRWDAKYATWDNFTGAPVDGYYANRVIGTEEMAAGIRKVANLASKDGYGLIVWDAYRPQRAVDHFVNWVYGEDADKTKRDFYPYVQRDRMIEDGYIASRSGHSRGSTVDLGLYRLDDATLLDMQGHFDYMDESSHHDYDGVSKKAQENRNRLRDYMVEGGFVPYAYEWWHYTLEKEPYQDIYFDFVVE